MKGRKRGQESFSGKTGEQSIITGYIRSYYLHPLITPTYWFSLGISFFIFFIFALYFLYFIFDI